MKAKRKPTKPKPKTRTLKGWVNVYPHFYTIPHRTKNDADMNAFNDRIACVRVNIPYREGQGL